MARLSSVALIALWIPAVAWADQRASNRELARNFDLPRLAAGSFVSDGRIGRAQIAPNAHVGFGMFGLKPEKSLLPPVTVREIDAPKQRRTALGFSLRF